MSTPDDDVQMHLNSQDTQELRELQHDEHFDEYSDFADDPETLEIIDQLLLEAASQHKDDVLGNAPLVVTDIEDYEEPRGVRLPKVLSLETTRRWEVQAERAGTQPKETVRDESTERRRSQDDEKLVKGRKDESQPGQTQQDAALHPTGPDTRSPLERFRKPPKKALSVTDLISPSWCELQYYYVLTKHGRKRRTPAMKQGSAVHQKLEEEVHTTVPVEITKKEDSWGLRIWNIVQGLRTLRDTGKTRELEVWGSVGGELVNGVIDELSYECPDPKLEEQVRSIQAKIVEPPLPEYQASMRDYLVSSVQREQGQSLADALRNGDGAQQENPSSSPRKASAKGDDERRIYITDVKTRQSPTLPGESAVRPTLLQLHLYHHMLENLAQGKFTLSQLAERYNFDVNETFSDSFIAQIGGLNQEVFALSQQSDEVRNELPSSTQDSVDILLQHNNLATLWDFMMEQLRLTLILPGDSSLPSNTANNETTNHDIQDPFIPPPSSLSQLPIPPSQPTRLSPVLTARYIATNYKHSSTSRILGSKSYLFNASWLTSQLYSSLGFWKGEREPKGVEVDDAWKCRVCEFRDECAWVKERDENMVSEAKGRRKVKKEIEVGEGKRSLV
ncbi:hypothetical protein H2200_002006 [Cladophialophora chaetospira]|uniref:Exonuclease V n=1 Tax=Cladophialophora chaetospira TaxID=386627 RepID=A0AA38XLY0_9EURO|nr:hypothetical protein H2200_002006 [Cladophialophora chaetospira]